MIVKFVRPRPMVLVQVSVSMGKNGKVMMPPTGGNSALKSFAVRSGLNFARLMLRLSKGSAVGLCCSTLWRTLLPWDGFAFLSEICVRGCPFPRSAGRCDGISERFFFYNTKISQIR